MPFYRHWCPRHGLFDAFRPMAQGGERARCGQCGQESPRIFTPPAIKVVKTERLQYGSGSPGRMISHKETGGLDIFIPSEGALEQDEVDYIAQGAIEKERARVKKGRKTELKARLEAYTQLALSQPPGNRAAAIKEAIQETGDTLVRST